MYLFVGYIYKEVVWNIKEYIRNKSHNFFQHNVQMALVKNFVSRNCHNVKIKLCDGFSFRDTGSQTHRML